MGEILLNVYQRHDFNADVVFSLLCRRGIVSVLLLVEVNSSTITSHSPEGSNRFCRHGKFPHVCDGGNYLVVGGYYRSLRFSNSGSRPRIVRFGTFYSQWFNVLPCTCSPLICPGIGKSPRRGGVLRTIYPALLSKGSICRKIERKQVEEDPAQRSFLPYRLL